MEKINRYFTRTVEHIHRVQKNMVYLVTECREYRFLYAGEYKFNLDEETCRKLMHKVMMHDQSKFSEEQFLPYIELTEYYHQRKALGNKDYEYPPLVAQEVEDAVDNHYRVENHHPERNKGLAKLMTFEELVETVCDLQAMAQEFNEGSCRGYFENVWVKKQSENFYDDYDWEMTQGFMRQIIYLFERKGIVTGEVEECI